jgi:hypothetical protein
MAYDDHEIYVSALILKDRLKPWLLDEKMDWLT